MVASSTTMATVEHIKLYFDTCDSQMYTPFKGDFVILNEEQNAGTLNRIDYGINI